MAVVQTKYNKLEKAYRYADDIKNGVIPACKWVKLAVDRFHDDLKNGHNRGIWFNEDRASMALESFDFYNIKKTIEVAGRNGRTSKKNVYRPFELEGWQTFITANLYGFYQDDVRRFTTAVTVVPRKNGKSTYASANGITGLCFDGEIEAQIYCAATKKDQAKIVFKEAKKMINLSPTLKQLFGREDITRDAIAFPRTDSFFHPVSSDYNTLDGLNPHFVILDETHEYRDSGLYDIFVSGMVERLNPMIFIITTAGFHKEYWFYQYLESVLGILENKFVDDNTFVIYYTLDSEDEINDPDKWIKANPNLGVSVQQRALAREVEQMRNIPTKRVGVLTKNFNIFVDAAETWVESEIWAANARDLSILDEKPIKSVYMGIDLASVKDIFAISLLFCFEDGTYYTMKTFYAPEETIANKYTGTLAMNMGQWVQQGYIKTTPGRVIDKDYVIADILQMWQTWGVSFGGYDPYKSSEMIEELNQTLGKEWIYDEAKQKMVEMFKLQPVAQRITTLCTATEKFQQLIYEGKLFHDNNPVMNWMLANVVPRRDPNGNVMPDRKNEKKKIDGVMSDLDAIDIMLRYSTEDDENLSDYINVRK